MDRIKKIVTGGLAAILIGARTISAQGVQTSETRNIPDLATYNWIDNQGKNISMIYIREFDEDAQRYKLIKNPETGDIGTGWFFKLNGDDNYYFSEYQKIHDSKWLSGERKIQPSTLVAQPPQAQLQKAPLVASKTIIKDEPEVPGLETPVPVASETQKSLPAPQVPVSTNESLESTGPQARVLTEQEVEESKYKKVITAQGESARDYTKMNLEEGIKPLFDEVWESYMKNDAELYRTINKSLGDLGKNIGDVKTVQDDKFEGMNEDLNSIRKSLEERTQKETLYKGDAAKGKVKTLYEELKSRKGEYETHLRTAKEGLKQLDEALKNSEILSQKGREEIAATRANVEQRIKDLETFVGNTGNLIDYISKIPASEEKFPAVKFNFSGDDDFEGIVKFLRESKEKARNEFSSSQESPLYQTWFNKFFQPEVTGVIDNLQSILNEYANPNQVHNVLQGHDLENGLSQKILAEKSKLENTVKDLRGLIGASQPLFASQPAYSQSYNSTPSNLEIEQGPILAFDYAPGFWGLNSPTSDLFSNPLASVWDSAVDFGKAAAQIKIGGRFGPLGLTLDLGAGFGKTISSSTDTMGPITGVRSTSDLFYVSPGVSIEGYIPLDASGDLDLVLGAGAGIDMTSRRTSEGFQKNGAWINMGTDKPNPLTVDRFDSNYDAKAYLGLQGRNGLGLEAGYDLRKGPFIGLRYAPKSKYSNKQ